MVAYSFKQRFVVPILIGLGQPVEKSAAGMKPKLQTIRAIGKRRHARPEEQLQLYQGMRTRDCWLIGRSTCTAVHPIAIKIGKSAMDLTLDGARLLSGGADEFALRDGFESLEDMHAFWRENHPRVRRFDGVCVLWKP